ncbi:dynamin family protein [Helicobacter sp. 11S02596-1]|uniref:dynamin family protein n=1 Tax=Helicobacter sp. 11S02596-1 TaxID=1476194 RepID=UPI000BA507D1|nr:dynamin family protein [Helicobacter sp. 11S02596-1]PAF42094.1 hypothetical protein BJI48_07215 [Helicobacter sp. 11S02596-1]
MATKDTIAKDTIAGYFFSLVYSQDIPLDTPSNPLPIDFTHPEAKIEEIFAILLAYNNRNKQIFFHMPAFKALLQTLHTAPNHHAIQSLQKAVLDVIESKNNLKMIQEIFEYLATLKTAGIILYEEEQCIKTSFKYQIHSLNATRKKHSKTPKINKTKALDFQTSWFYQHLQTIQDIFKQTQHTPQMPSWLLDMMKYQVDKILGTKFQISLCGIAKSGKSTLLNALLCEDILPISAIPESTTKITITHSPKAKADITFLTQEQWSHLLENLYFDDDLNATITESKVAFGPYIDDCITQKGLQIEVKPEEIKTYASSEHHSKISYLIKKITIYSPTEFLKNNLVFINTPNTNTKFNYKTHQTENAIAQSIITLYLINASKPISQKDVEFLSHIIHYENLEKVLIVFTRADLVNLSDLKHLSQNILEEIQKSQNQPQKILKKNIAKIDFIPVSSTLALLHRTNESEEALSRGYDLEDTGILALENYLNDIIFKHPTNYSKNALYSTYAILEWAIKKYLDLLKNPIQVAIPDLDKKCTSAQKQILSAKEAFIKSIEESAQKAKTNIKDLGYNLKEHLIDFITYETSKNKHINASRLENIIANNLKDSLKYLIEKMQEDYDKKMQAFIESSRQACDFIAPMSLESDLLALKEKAIITTERSEYTEGDIALYTEELKTYINHILRDGAKLKDIEKNIDKAFDLSYQNIIIYLEEKIHHKTAVFSDQTHQMIETLNAIITHANTQAKDLKDLGENEKSKQIEHFKALQSIIHTQMEALKASK